MHAALHSRLRTLTRCLVCGFSELRTDEVVDRGVVLLAECGRCAHRWTAPLPTGGDLRPVAAPVRAAPPRSRGIAA